MRPRECSSQRLLAMMLRLSRAWSLCVVFWLGWGCSLYGMVGSRSLVGRPNRHVAGDIFVSGLGPFRYASSAL